MSSVPWRDMTDVQKQQHLEQTRKWREANRDRENKSRREWYQNHKDQRTPGDQAYRGNHRDYYRKASKRNYARLKQGAVLALGGKCCRCGCDDIRCLEIDHIIPVRGDRSIYGVKLYRSIVTGDSTENLQVLCANCHAIKTYEDGNE